jgi:hypothetical protein
MVDPFIGIIILHYSNFMFMSKETTWNNLHNILDVIDIVKGPHTR